MPGINVPLSRDFDTKAERVLYTKKAAGNGDGMKEGKQEREESVISV